MVRLVASYIALGLLFCVEARPADSRSGDEQYVLPPLGHTFFCMRYSHDCERTRSTQALRISPDSRWRKMTLINNSVNAAIAPRSNPSRTWTHWRLAPQEGNCNDYSVTKRHELLKAGWPSSSLLLAEVALISTGEHHLILIVTDTRANWVLDNLNKGIVSLAVTQNEYALVRIESSENPQFWTKTGFSRLLPGENPISAPIVAAATTSSTGIDHAPNGQSVTSHP